MVKLVCIYVTAIEMYAYETVRSVAQGTGCTCTCII